MKILPERTHMIASVDGKIVALTNCYTFAESEDVALTSIHIALAERKPEPRPLIVRVSIDGKTVVDRLAVYDFGTKAWRM